MTKFFLFLLGLLLVSNFATAQSSDPLLPASGFDLQRVSEGVYAAIRKEPHGLTTNANSVLIVNDRDVLVVDTTLTLGTAKQLLASLRTLTSKPVTYVINTHWHDDHILGNDVFRQAFPKAKFVGHRALLDYLPTTGLNNRRQALAPNGYPGFIKALRTRLQKNESVFGGRMDDEERATYASDIKIGESYVEENQSVPIVLPTLAIDRRLTLRRGKRTIEIMYLGRGHTGGDIVVQLPEEKIVIAGDLVIWPVPYVGSPQSHPGDWADTLFKLLALKPAVIIPGHGPVLRDEGYVRLMANLFNSIRDQVAGAIARGENLEQTQASIHLDEFEKTFAGESRMRRLVFRNYILGPAVEAAFLDASEAKK